MTTLTTQMSFLLLLLLSIFTFHKTMSTTDHAIVSCNEKDREILLIFKEGINDSYGRISTWTTENNCCAWEGIHCDNITGRVTRLELSNNFEEEQPKYLKELQLRGCKLNNFILNPSIKYMNLSSLITLNLSFNNFTSHSPHSFFNLTKDITYLDLSDSNIQGEIPSSLLSLRNLRHLDLSYNKLQGSIPDEIGQLAHIQKLYLSSNNFSGEISKITFSKLNRLNSLDLSSSNVVFQFDFDWVPPFQLSSLVLSQTNQGPNFPSWIYTQKSLEYFDLSSSGISLVDRNKFSSVIQGISILYLSNNSISVDISNLTLRGIYLELDHNNFTGKLPIISPMARFVDLSYNSFSGSIPNTWNNLKELSYINLWSNRLSGEVSMDLSSSSLDYINLGKNDFFGTIPINLTQNLQVIILRAIKFEGNIPSQLFNLSYLYHLDLAHNKLSGSIPKCVNNLTHMVTFNVKSRCMGVVFELFTKGQDYYMYTIGPDRRTIDLSSNNFSGDLPSELFELVQVQTLNLSHNDFTGTIPKTIGGMKNMESLDLSSNKLYGEIPQSMILLNFLEYLNLSNNNLKGKIPIGSQLQSFNASSYIENPNLCGAPLNNCTTKEESPKTATPSRENEDDDSIKESLYLGMGVGFAVGFWGICGSLFLIRKWRHAYFQFVDGLGDKLYVTLMVKLNSFHRN
ncbi:receptor-like protein EIX2 [Vicia villosa]|uniref:receptor-like protein EIX2 n=1 Tax=Vicia villosa TaxID=3911 RepID=UPI00273B789C|nr:receptor-like protein EIX2 [Vicia villosa]